MLFCRALLQAVALFSLPAASRAVETQEEHALVRDPLARALAGSKAFASSLARSKVTSHTTGQPLAPLPASFPRLLQPPLVSKLPCRYSDTGATRCCCFLPVGRSPKQRPQEADRDDVHPHPLVSQRPAGFAQLPSLLPTCCNAIFLQLVDPAHLFVVGKTGSCGKLGRFVKLQGTHSTAAPTPPRPPAPLRCLLQV